MTRQVRRHGRRAIRSSIAGPALPNPDSRVLRFELDARSALELLQHHLPDELRGVKVGFATAPLDGMGGGAGARGGARSSQPLFYAIDRRRRSIVLYRMPIQRAQGLHVDDAEHRRLFIGHCVYQAVCEYLGRDPWDLLPGYFDHY